MKKILLLCLFLVGCTNQHEFSDQETGKQCQVAALKEFLKENAILEDPIIIRNNIQLNSDTKEFTGIIKFKFATSNKIQVAKCYSIREMRDTIFVTYNYTFFCESKNN